MGANRALSPRMIGRQAQLSALEDHLDLVRCGSGRVVFLAGDAGIGKTRLLREFVSRVRARSDIEVLEGHCYDEDPAVPYGPFVSAIRSFIRGAGSVALVQAIEPWTRDLALLLPELGVATVLPGDMPEPQLQKQRLFAAIHHAIQPATDQQCRVVILEDLHWSDQTSQELIRYLVRSIERDRVLIIGTYRTDELHRRHPLTHLVAQLTRERLYQEVRLAPLSRAELQDMLEATLDRTLPGDFVDALYAHTEGNPFFVEEVLKSLIAHTDLDRIVRWKRGINRLTVPISVKDNIVSRTTDLDATTAEVLTYAAVIGRHFDFDLLLRLTGLTETELLQAVTLLVERQLVVEEPDDTGDRYSFRHALTREAVYDDMLGRERRIKHREVLRVLEEMYQDDHDRILDQLAYHSWQARDSAKAARYARLAGERAARMYAYREAIAHYEVALETLDPGALRERAALLEALCEVTHPIGDVNRYIRFCREAQQTYEQVGDTRKVADLHRRLGRMLWDRGDRQGAFEHTWTALRMLEDEPPGHELAMVYSGLSNLYMVSSHPRESVEWGEKALRLAEALGDIAVESHALNNIGVSLIELGEPERGVSFLQRSLDLALREGMAFNAIRAYQNLGCDLAVLGRFQQSRALLQEGIAFARQVGWEFGVNSLLEKLAWVEMERGQWAEAHRLLDQASTMGSWEISIEGLLTRSELLLRQGRIDEAYQLLEQFSVSGINTHLHGHLLVLLARVYLVRGDRQQALAIMDQCVLFWHTHDLTAFVHEDMHYYGIAVYLQAGQPDRCYALLRAFRASMRQTPIVRALLADAEGLVAACEGRHTDAVEHFRRAVATWAELEYPFDEAQSRRYLAESLLQERDVARRTQAQQELIHARSIFERLGAPLELAAVDAVIERYDLGRATPKDGAHPLDSLTRREREVIVLLARGYSNRDIARDLVISPKTAEVHVSNILGKLGLTSRAQVAAYAVEHGLVELSASTSSAN